MVDPCVRKDAISDWLYCMSMQNATVAMDDRLIAFFFFLLTRAPPTLIDAIDCSIAINVLGILAKSSDDLVGLKEGGFTQQKRNTGSFT